MSIMALFYSTLFILSLLIQFNHHHFVQSQLIISPEIQTIPCDPNNRPTTCPSTYDPVCVPQSIECIRAPCPQQVTVSNPCQACLDPNITFYRTGPCPAYCDPLLGDKDCSNDIVNPTCGATNEFCTQDSCRKTFESSCAACLDPNVVIYRPGLCPNAAGVSCKTPRGCQSCEQGEFDPICGVYTQDCNDNSCRKTFANSCCACEDKAVVAYFPGDCDGGTGFPEEENVESGEEGNEEQTEGEMEGEMSGEVTEGNSQEELDLLL